MCCGHTSVLRGGHPRMARGAASIQGVAGRGAGPTALCSGSICRIAISAPKLLAHAVKTWRYLKLVCMGQGGGRGGGSRGVDQHGWLESWLEQLQQVLCCNSNPWPTLH